MKFSKPLGASIALAFSLAGCSGGGLSGATPQSRPASDSNASAARDVASATTDLAGASELARELASGVLVRACDDGGPGTVRCHALVRTTTSGMQAAAAAAAPSGYGPSQLQAAYGLGPSIGNAGGLVAIVDAYDDPNAESDLGTYRAQYGEAACTTANGCFKKVSQTGTTTYPTGNAGWGEEISLDLDMVSANCPKCKILLVEAKSTSTANLAAAVNEAAKLGAVAISNSYGGGESSGETSYASSYSHPGVVITASAGDGGYGVEVPAAYNTVVAVGGTTLSAASTPRGWSETVWSGSGSGCSAYIAKPSFQHDTGCAKRTVGDVSYEADPNTGVAVYDSYKENGWLVFGGTSVSSPAIASIFALAGNASSSGAAQLYATGAALYDVTSGSDGSCGGTYLCTGKTGYDAPTGNGTPDGITAF